MHCSLFLVGNLGLNDSQVGDSIIDQLKTDSNHSEPNNLFAELQSTELNKLEAENSRLNHSLESCQRSLELAQSEVLNKQDRINGLLAQLDVIMSVKSLADSEFEAKDIDNDLLSSHHQFKLNNTTDNTSKKTALSASCILESEDDSQVEFKKLRRHLCLVENRYSVALRQISSMQHDLWRYREREKIDTEPELGSEEALKQEVIRLQSCLEQSNEEIKALRSQLTIGQDDLRAFDTKLGSISEMIGQSLVTFVGIYRTICLTAKENPQKQVSFLNECFV